MASSDNAPLVVLLTKDVPTSALLARFSALGVEVRRVSGSRLPNSAVAALHCGDRHIASVPPEHVDSATGKIERYVAKTLAHMLMHERADDVGLEDALLCLQTLPPGADSGAIWLLDTKPRSVLKIGHSKVVEMEIRFLEQTYAVGVDVFPRIWAHGVLPEASWYLMEAGVPDSGEDAIFASRHRDQLRSGWQSDLQQLLKPMAKMYASSLTKGGCKVADYHYRQRIPKLFERKDFHDTITAFETVHAVETLLNRPLRLQGTDLPSVRTMLSALEQILPENSVSHVTMIHGDLHLKNLVRRTLTDGFLFLDPRLKWDDMHVDRFGYSDPVYDFATLLHSVGGMTTILHSIAKDTASDLVSFDTEGGTLEMTFADDLNALIREAADVFVDLGQACLPDETRGQTFETRLFAGAANATFGWLKYRNAVQSAHGWWAMFALGVTYLAIATGHLKTNA